MTVDPVTAWSPEWVEVAHSSGPESVLCDHPPEDMPTSGPVGFVTNK